MMIWILFLALTAAAILLMFRKSPVSRDEKNQTADFYKSQLQELDREMKDGLIAGDEARSARIEIERRLAQTLRPQAASSEQFTNPQRLMIGGGLLTLGISLAIYTQLGRPDLAHLPGRTAPAELAAAKPPPEIDAMITQLEQRLKDTPDDVEGWRRLGWVQARVERFPEAVRAYEKALALSPSDAGIKSGLAEAIVRAAGDRLEPRARKLFAEAAATDPNDSLAIFYLARADEDDGNLPGALARWRKLAELPDLPEPNRNLIRRHLIRLGAATGSDVAPSLALLDKQNAKPQAQAPAADASQIDSMIAGLAQKLVDNPDNLQGWMMLIRSLKVRQGDEAAREALSQAQKFYANRPDENEQLKKFAVELAIPPAQ